MNRKIFILTIIILIISAAAVFSCEITVVSDKADYKTGDTAVLTITIKQDHNRCLQEGIEPLIKSTGMELLGKTAFTKTDQNIWQIKYKVKIIDKNAVLTAIRECPKDGDKEDFIVKVTG